MTAAALADLRAAIRAEGGPLAAALVADGGEELAAPLVRSGPRTAAAPDEYGLLTEAILEGFLLHYGRPRLLASPDEGLRLLAGDYLYAAGLVRLARLGDLAAVEQLADLISLCARARAGSEGAAASLHEAYWAATLIAVAYGAQGGDADRLAAAKAAARADGGSAGGLLEWARAAARRNGAAHRLDAFLAALHEHSAPAAS